MHKKSAVGLITCHLFFNSMALGSETYIKYSLNSEENSGKKTFSPLFEITPDGIVNLSKNQETYYETTSKRAALVGAAPKTILNPFTKKAAPPKDPIPIPGIESRVNIIFYLIFTGEQYDINTDNHDYILEKNGLIRVMLQLSENEQYKYVKNFDNTVDIGGDFAFPKDPRASLESLHLKAITMNDILEQRLRKRGYKEGEITALFSDNPSLYRDALCKKLNEPRNEKWKVIYKTTLFTPNHKKEVGELQKNNPGIFRSYKLLKQYIEERDKPKN